MDLGKTAYGIIGLVIAVLIIATVAVPVISDAQSTQETVHNNALDSRLSLIDDAEGEIVISKDAGSAQWKIGGQTITLPGESVLYMSDGLYLMSTASGGQLRISEQGFQAIGTDQAFSLTASSDSLSYTIGSGSAVTMPVEWSYRYALSGDYLSVKLSQGPVYVNSVNDISVFVHASGMTITVHDGAVSCVADGTGQELAASMQVALTAVDGYDNLYTVGENSITITVGGESPTTVVVPSASAAFVASSEVVGLKSGGSAAQALLGAVALMLFIVPVMMAVRIISGRDE